MTTPLPLALASASPRRQALLSALGIPFDVIVSNEPEDHDPAHTPEQHALALANRKARAVARTLSSGLVLGADTIVVLDDLILGKPRDDADAARMLRALSGRPHQVITGVALVDAATNAARTRAVISTVHLLPLSETTIATYVASGEPRDKAGAYAIQGAGGQLISRLEGCFNNVVGLPMCAVGTLLEASGVAVPSPWIGCRLPDGTPCPESD